MISCDKYKSLVKGKNIKEKKNFNEDNFNEKINLIPIMNEVKIKFIILICIISLTFLLINCERYK